MCECSASLLIDGGEREVHCVLVSSAVPDLKKQKRENLQHPNVPHRLGRLSFLQVCVDGGQNSERRLPRRNIPQKPAFCCGHHGRRPGSSHRGPAERSAAFGASWSLVFRSVILEAKPRPHGAAFRRILFIDVRYRGDIRRRIDGRPAAHLRRLLRLHRWVKVGFCVWSLGGSIIPAHTCSSGHGAGGHVM